MLREDWNLGWSLASATDYCVFEVAHCLSLGLPHAGMNMLVSVAALNPVL